MFEPFFTTKGSGKGTGLGLSMVYGFVKQSGGHVKIYSEEGQGTTIKIYLPQARETDGVLEITPVASIEGGQETILIVEDDALVRNFVTSQLNSLGYTTLVASNAAEALALIEQGAALDLLFTDVIMPGAMNGRQLAEEVVKRRPAVNYLRPATLRTPSFTMAGSTPTSFCCQSHIGNRILPAWFAWQSAARLRPR